MINLCEKRVPSTLVYSIVVQSAFVKEDLMQEIQFFFTIIAFDFLIAFGRRLIVRI